MSDEDLLITCDSLLSLIYYREPGGLSDLTLRDIRSLLGPLRKRTDEIARSRIESVVSR